MVDEPPYDLLRTYTGEDDSKRTDRVVWPRGLGTESHPVQSVHVDDVLSIPEVDDLSNALEGDGNVVWVTGAGADTQGVYQWDGSTWVQLAGSGGGKTEEEIEDIVDSLSPSPGPSRRTTTTGITS